eukprot:CAMPEP_0184711626 /NCGR_PEP_ID=MMETSP0314-20130426/2270_1 /TAXON_ID=38298 /ORGANISM="Rhodella maculata, Strain CCMP 736" /LENGTH=144 /DNA_ID=CAMNT_0027173815 /DNA_START=3 /DNA_END=433 /DNA_ORIENTATION=-
MDPSLSPQSSSETLAEFFAIAIQTILYTHRVYPREIFDARQKYGVTVHISRSRLLTSFLTSTITSLKALLDKNLVDTVAVAILGPRAPRVLLRYVFRVAVLRPAVRGVGGDGAKAELRFRAMVLRVVEGEEAAALAQVAEEERG